MAYKVVEPVRRLEFGMPMALNAKAARILGGTLLITTASTLAGCASIRLAEAGSAQNIGPSRVIHGSISDSRPDADGCHVWRDVFLDPARVSVDTLSLFGLPVVFIRGANCPI